MKDSVTHTFEQECSGRLVVLECECSSIKNHKVTFDGGSTGNYVIEMCQTCYDNDDKRFIISEERLQ